MNLSTNSLKTKKHKLILAMVFVSFTGLMSMNQSYASSYYNQDRDYKNKHGYSDSRSNSRSQHKNKRHHSRHAKRQHRSYDRRHQPVHGHHHRNKHNYRSHQHHNIGHNQGHNHGYKYSEHRDNYPRIERYSTNYSSSIRYNGVSHHNNAAATLVGGAIGGAIANDISGGDGAATAFGIVTGAVLANGFNH